MKLDDDQKLHNYDYVVYFLEEVIRNEKDSADNIGGLFKGRMMGYEEILKMLTKKGIN